MRLLKICLTDFVKLVGDDLYFRIVIVNFEKSNLFRGFFLPNELDLTWYLQVIKVS